MSPCSRIDVYGIDFANVLRASSGWPRRREPADFPIFEGDGGRRLVAPDELEGVPVCTILSPESVGILIREQPSVSTCQERT